MIRITSFYNILSFFRLLSLKHLRFWSITQHTHTHTHTHVHMYSLFLSITHSLSLSLYLTLTLSLSHTHINSMIWMCLYVFVWGREIEIKKERVSVYVCVSAQQISWVGNSWVKKGNKTLFFLIPVSFSWPWHLDVSMDDEVERSLSATFSFLGQKMLSMVLNLFSIKVKHRSLHILLF